MCTVIDGNYHFCKVWQQSRQYSPVKAEQDFSMLALVAILCSKAKNAGDVHN
jgi:hypothetical protein